MSACVAVPACNGTTYPNPYVYKASTTCACCPPVIVMLELSSPSDQLGNPRITPSVADSLNSHVESVLGLSNDQVTLYGVNSADTSDTATFLVFRNDTLAWSGVDVAEMVNRLRNNSAFAAPEFASAALLTATAGTPSNSHPFLLPRPFLLPHPLISPLPSHVDRGRLPARAAHPASAARLANTSLSQQHHEQQQQRRQQQRAQVVDHPAHRAGDHLHRCCAGSRWVLMVPRQAGTGAAAAAEGAGGGAAQGEGGEGEAGGAAASALNPNPLPSFSPSIPPPLSPLFPDSANNTTSSSSSSSEPKWWTILLIVLAIIFTGAALAAAGFSWYRAKLARELLLRQKALEEEQRKEKEEKEKQEEEEKEKENGEEPGSLKKDESRSMRKTSSLSASQSKARSQSDFGLKVQENFVKALALEDVIRATDNFASDNELGSGGYGTVYKGVAPGGTLWAVKRAKNANEEGIEDFQNEVDVISKMSHRNLVRLLGYCDEKGEQILVYEFVANGTLRQHIRPSNPTKRPLTFEQRLEIAVGAAEGLKYLHSAAEPAIIHRDIKCDNILLDNDMMAKVADFGVFKKSGSNKPGDEMNTRVVGTPGYVDPEYYQTYKVTTKSDVYSFGVVLLELITGRPPIMEDPSVENESYMVTLSRWATPKIAAGKVESILDPRLTGAYPRQALNMLAAVTAMCVRRLGRDRPEMAEVATRLAEIKYFLKPSSGILEPVMNLFPDDDLEDREDNLMDIAEEEEDYDHVPEYIPGTSTGVNPYTSADIAAPVSMVFSDR
ncbi:unnamed protein product [Closterium sp. NIES-64]|nr:unnamed protein product [Closterium sp. NIES-64]